ncbi:glycogen debranching protein GlgX [Octadecabacter sp. R77987]|uniref:glycogen debranching protein GlgX n=1 Tax=Octadecabacter sp. R77987 TaxID=3093874 RepID=UPI0036730A0F
MISAGTPHRLGAHHTGAGVNFAVFSEHASKIELCLFSPDGQTETARIPLPEKSGPVWHGFVPDLAIGTLYGFRAHGPFAPEQGHRFNPHKLLLDPYTREVHGSWQPVDALFGYDPANSAKDLSLGTEDSGPYVPKSVVSDPALFAPVTPDPLPDTPCDLIYEAHVKGLTQECQSVPDTLRGTYEGIASDAMIAHYQRLGVKSVELLPVHALVDETFLQGRGLTNYWGYNSIGFFAAEPRYFGPDGIKGFRAMVAKLRRAGISVILDVVYNHTAEGDQNGPTLCFRGLDNASYYRLNAGQPRYYANDAGTGNTLDLSHPFVLRMVMDSLRFWVECMGVSGFRFDLATTLGREDHGFDPRGGFFDALLQDPVLSQVQLIAEPWDIGPGGYRLGEFPYRFAEWNDRYRDTLRRYWRGDDHATQDLAAGLLGTAERFDRAGRSAASSVNFVTSHDGFTLADVTRYSRRHNQANKESNKDGHHANYSDNCGVEGPSDDPAIIAKRAQRQRNILATLFLSQGTPMLLAGDEMGNSQGGNNNAYCQDNPIGWINWAGGDQGLADFVARLSAFRSAHPALHQKRFLHGAPRAQDNLPDVVWSDFQGEPLEWRDPGLASFTLVVRGAAEMPAGGDDPAPVFMVFNRDGDAQDAVVPPAQDGYEWVCQIDTFHPSAANWPVTDGFIRVQGQTVVALALAPKGD